MLSIPGVAIAQSAETASLSRNHGSVSAVETDIVDHGIRTGHPFHTDGPQVSLAGINTDTCYDIGPALRGLDDGPGRPLSLKGGSVVRHIDHGGRRIEPDQDGVRPECQSVTDAIPSHRQVKRLVLRDSFFEGRRVVGPAVAFCSQSPNVDPGCAIRKAGNVRLHWSGQRGCFAGLERCLDLPGGTQAGYVQAVTKLLDHVGGCDACDCLAGFPKPGEDRDVPAVNVSGVNLGPGIVLIAYNQRRAGDVLKAHITQPKLIRFLGDNRYGGGHVFEMRAHHCKSGLIATDGRLALSLECTINNENRPPGSRPFGNDANLPTMKVEVLNLVTDILQSRSGRTEPEVHVRKIAVLRHMEADGDGRRIAGADLDIDIAHGAIERAGATIPRGTISSAESAPS